jgi:hypothetical protein
MRAILVCMSCPKCNAEPLTLSNGDRVCASTAGIACPALHPVDEVTLTVRVEPDLAQRVRARAEKDGISTAAWMRKALGRAAR